MMMKQENRKKIPCSWIESINNSRMANLLKALYKFIKVPIKISMTFKKDTD